MHSSIGSISVVALFAPLTERRDTRTDGMIGEMCRCEHQIVNMDVVEPPGAARRALVPLKSSASIRKALHPAQRELPLPQQIRQVVWMVKGPLRPRPHQ